MQIKFFELNKRQFIEILIVLLVLLIFFTKNSIIFISFKNFTNSNYVPLGIGKFNDNNISKSFKEFWITDTVKGKIESLERRFRPETNDIYNMNKENELIEEIDKLNPNNYELFEKILIPEINNKISQTKSNIPPTLKESSKLSMCAKPSSFKNTALYWFFISKKLQKNNKDEIALILNQGLFYLSKDLETNYPISGFFKTKLGTIYINSIACNNIIKWASKPRPNYKSLSKSIAKDLLELVANEYPFSRNIEFDWEFDEDYNNHLAEEDNFFAKSYLKRNIYKQRMELYYSKPLSIADKPLYESKNDFKKLNIEIQKFGDFDDSLTKLITDLIFFPVEFIVKTSAKFKDFEKEKNEYELNLAKMEFAAITLAINSYYCENNKLPETMDDLSKWFGKELPVNRLTNEPYTINSKDKHTLFNKGVHESPKETSDDFYFDFSF